MAGEVLNGNARSVGTVVRPQKVTVDPSVVKHVVDFFNDVLPQTLQPSAPHKAIDREIVLWLKVEQPERLGGISDAFSPVFLTLGYANGVQIWALEPRGEAWEVYSSRHGPIKTLRLLPLPEEVYGSDLFLDKRPLIAVCDSSTGSVHSSSNISIISLATGEKVHNIKFRSVIEEIYCNQRVILVTFPDRFVVIDSCTMREKFNVNASFPVHLVSPHPVALGKRWIAYSEGKVHDMYHSLGGRIIDGVPSYTASVISAAKTISQGISNIGEVVASSISGSKKSPSSNFVTTAGEGKHEGVVTVLDIDTAAAGDGEVSLEKGSVNRIGVVAHFLAHSSSPVAVLAFNVDGTLLLSASQTGQNFHIFRISPHPAGSSMATAHHLYTLHRGDTTATVQDVTFSLDSRWVAVTSLRATTHVFPITPYGGPITYRTHSTSRVVNKASRFVKSAGLDELETSRENGTVPMSSQSGNSSPRYTDPSRAGIHVTHAPLVITGNASAVSGPRSAPTRNPPFVVQPLSQIKHAGPSKSTHLLSGSMPSSKTPPSGADVVKVAACFTSRRARNSGDAQVCDALLIATSHGALVEYSLQPVVGADVDRISDDVPVGLNVHAQAQWVLNRHLSHAEFQPPFSDNHLLLNCPAFAGKRKNSLADENAGYQLRLRRRQEDIVNTESANEAWLSEVEIMTHAGPARRLWMGPQFRFAPISTPGCATGVVLNSLPQTEIQRTGSDWDLTMGTNLKFSNFRIHSAPVAMPGISGTNQALTIEAGSDYITRDSSSNEDLRLSEIADAMVDVHGRDQPDGITNFRTRGTEFDESPEDLSISSADSTGSGGQQAMRLQQNSNGGILFQQTGTTFPVDFDGTSALGGGGAAIDSQTSDSS